jgi:hypothetical protein
MRPIPPQINVVRKEEKEGKLSEFILRDLAARRENPSAIPLTYLMIARSLESPVARALLSACPNASALGIRCRLIVMLDEGVARGLSACDHIGVIDARLGTDLRLLDAHEFLVLGPTTAWIGDCMRRDPSKRDAYEFYSDDAVDAASSAARSFERMWRVSAPVLLRRLPDSVPDMAAIAAEAAPATIEAATRH